MPKGGLKFDTDKPGLDMLPYEALVQMAKVLDFGKIKYHKWNWTEGISYTRLISASLRHINAYNRGESKDPETGLSHIAHAAVNLCFLLWHEKFRTDLDDRHFDPDTVKPKGDAKHVDKTIRKTKSRRSK